jgi:hypothetical protein
MFVFNVINITVEKVSVFYILLLFYFIIIAFIGGMLLWSDNKKIKCCANVMITMIVIEKIISLFFR